MQKREYTIWLDTLSYQDTTEIRVQANTVTKLNATQVDVDGVILNFDNAEVSMISAEGLNPIF